MRFGQDLSELFNGLIRSTGQLIDDIKYKLYFNDNEKTYKIYKVNSDNKINYKFLKNDIQNLKIKFEKNNNEEINTYLTSINSDLVLFKLKPQSKSLYLKIKDCTVFNNKTNQEYRIFNKINYELKYTPLISGDINNYKIIFDNLSVVNKLDNNNTIFKYLKDNYQLTPIYLKNKIGSISSNNAVTLKLSNVYSGDYSEDIQTYLCNHGNNQIFTLLSGTNENIQQYECIVKQYHSINDFETISSLLASYLSGTQVTNDLNDYYIKYKNDANDKGFKISLRQTGLRDLSSIYTISELSSWHYYMYDNTSCTIDENKNIISASNDNPIFHDTFKELPTYFIINSNSPSPSALLSSNNNLGWEKVDEDDVPRLLLLLNDNNCEDLTNKISESTKHIIHGYGSDNYKKYYHISFDDSLNTPIIATEVNKIDSRIFENNSEKDKLYKLDSNNEIYYKFEKIENENGKIGKLNVVEQKELINGNFYKNNNTIYKYDSEKAANICFQECDPKTESEFVTDISNNDLLLSTTNSTNSINVINPSFSFGWNNIKNINDFISLSSYNIQGHTTGENQSFKNGQLIKVGNQNYQLYTSKSIAYLNENNSYQLQDFALMLLNEFIKEYSYNNNNVDDSGFKSYISGFQIPSIKECEITNNDQPISKLSDIYDYQRLKLDSNVKFNNEVSINLIGGFELTIDNDILIGNDSDKNIAGKTIFKINNKTIDLEGLILSSFDSLKKLFIDSSIITVPFNKNINTEFIQKDFDGNVSGFTLNTFLVNKNNLLYVNGDNNNTNIFDYRGNRLINSVNVGSDVSFIKNDNGWASNQFNVILSTNKSTVYQSSFIQLYLDEQCTKPFELVKNEETNSYELNEYSGNTKILISTYINNNYATGFEYQKIKTFQWEYASENYEVEYAKDWYNINTYINSNLFTDPSKNNYNLNIYDVITDINGYNLLFDAGDLETFFEQKGHFIDDIYINGIRKHDAGQGTREIVISDDSSINQNESLASIFRVSDSQVEIDSGSDSSEGKFEMNYKMFSFNFKIPEIGWNALNDIMYEKNQNYGKNIFDQSYPISSINTNFNSFEKLSGMAYNSILRFQGKMTIYFCVLKSGSFDPKGGFANYDTTYIEIPWVASFNKDRTLLFVRSNENVSLNFILDFETSSSAISKKSIINGLHFNCKVNNVDYSIQMPAFEVRGRRHFSDTNVTDIELFVRNRFHYDLLSDDKNELTIDQNKVKLSGFVYLGNTVLNTGIYTETNRPKLSENERNRRNHHDQKITEEIYENLTNDLLNSLVIDKNKVINKYIRFRDVANAQVQVDLASVIYNDNSNKTLQINLQGGSTNSDNASFAPFAYSFWEDDQNEGNNIELFNGLYYYQNMAPNLEKNICGYFKTWIPLAGINFVNEDVKLNVINKVKNLHIGYKKYSDKDYSNNRYFTIEYNNPLSSANEYVGLKSFDGSCVIIRKDRYAQSPNDVFGDGYVTTLRSNNKLLNGEHIVHRFYTDELNTLYYCRVFYLDTQAGMIYEDASLNTDNSCIASGLFLPPAITDVSITFKVYQLPNGEEWLVNSGNQTVLNSKASEFIPSDSFNLKQMGTNQKWLGDFQFGAEMKVNMKIPTTSNNLVKNVAWGSLQGHGSFDNAFDENTNRIFTNSCNVQMSTRNIFKCNTLFEYRNFGYNNFGWGQLGYNTSTAFGKVANVIKLNTWSKTLFWSTYSAIDEDKNPDIKQHTQRPGNWNPIDRINYPHYGTIYPIISNDESRFITFEIVDHDTSIDGIKPLKPLCWANYITYSGSEPTYDFSTGSYISLISNNQDESENIQLNCIFVGWNILLKRDDYEKYKNIMKVDGSKFKIKYHDSHWKNNNTNEQYYANVKFAGCHWDDYVIAQNAVSFIAYYDEHARAHITIKNRGLTDYSKITYEEDTTTILYPSVRETSISTISNKWQIITNTLNKKWVNGNNLTTPISGVSADGVTLPSVGEYLKIYSSKYDSSLSSQDAWYCKNTQVIQNETITKYKYDTKNKQWIPDGTIQSCDYGNLNNEVRWVVAGYNTFKTQIKKPHMVLISDRPITLPVSAYYTYPNDSFLLKQGKWIDTGCSKFLNNEFLNSFIDGEFKEHLENVSLDTAKCDHRYINYVHSKGSEKSRSILKTYLDSMDIDKNEHVKIFIPSRRNIWSSITMYPGSRRYSTGEVGLEENDRAKINDKKITYTALKSGVTFTCNDDPYLPIFNVPPVGTAYTGTNPGGWGHLNKNWYLLDKTTYKPINQKAFFLRGTNRSQQTYFVDYDGSVRIQHSESSAPAVYGSNYLFNGYQSYWGWYWRSRTTLNLPKIIEQQDNLVGDSNLVYTFINHYWPYDYYWGWGRSYWNYYTYNGYHDKSLFTGNDAPLKNTVFAEKGNTQSYYTYSYASARSNWWKEDGMTFVGYYYAAHQIGLYKNRVWILKDYLNEEKYTPKMVVGFNNLKNLYQIFGQVYESAGGTMNDRMLSDPYRNSMSVYYFKQAVENLAKGYKNWINAKSQNKNYTAINNYVWKNIEWLINSTYGMRPFNYNNADCKANKYPIGRRIGILPICIIS